MTMPGTPVLSDTDSLTLLGHTAPATISAEQIETFPVPTGCDEVQITGDELVSRCPLTKQTDIYQFTISYRPGGRCLESKALKLYLAGFRDTEGAFAETLSVRIRDDLVASLARDSGTPIWLTVRLKQNTRGGMQITSNSTYPDLPGRPA